MDQRPDFTINYFRIATAALTDQRLNNHTHSSRYPPRNYRLYAHSNQGLQRTRSLCGSAIETTVLLGEQHHNLVLHQRLQNNLRVSTHQHIEIAYSAKVTSREIEQERNLQIGSQTVEVRSVGCQVAQIGSLQILPNPNKLIRQSDVIQPRAVNLSVRIVGKDVAIIQRVLVQLHRGQAQQHQQQRQQHQRHTRYDNSTLIFLLHFQI